MSVPTGGRDDESDAGTAQARFAATVVDEWLRGGVVDAVVCPGSRSAPLALAVAARPELRLHVRLDERSAGFFALGLSLATGRPTVVVTTSGTAAVELHPAVVEAHHARVPLLVCTADRPPELHHVGAPQVVDQEHLFGRAVRWFVSPGPADPVARSTWRSLAARALHEATTGPLGPGPVHLNLAFREPLHAAPADPEPGVDGPVQRVHRAGSGGPQPGAAPVERWVGGPGREGMRGVIVAGAGCGAPDEVLRLARRLGWPVLADPRSGCRRRGPGARGVVGAADSFLRSPEVAAALRPEAALVLGAPWSSKVLAAFLAAAFAPGADGGRALVAIDPWWQWRDPDRLAADVVVADPTEWVRAALRRLDDVGVGDAAGDGAGDGAPSGWLECWQAVEAAAQRAIDAELGAGRDGGLNEPRLARHLLEMVPPRSRLVVSSSMPVRDLEWFAPPMDVPPVVFANRGANGIDGVCSTALGVAASGGDPVVGLVGDLAFLHDVSALVRSEPTAHSAVPAGCTLVVVDNHGGGIFSFLPQAADPDTARFETLFATPQQASVASVAAGFGLPVVEVETTEALRVALATPPPPGTVNVVRATLPDRAENVRLHERLTDAVAGAARVALGGNR